MARHSANAQAIAEYLGGNPAVERVYYPGLPSHPGHEVACEQMSGFGGVESLIGYPCEMTHASVRGTALEVPDKVVSLSGGFEDVADLIADLASALSGR